jgi:hypothetical protein
MNIKKTISKMIASNESNINIGETKSPDEIAKWVEACHSSQTNSKFSIHK